MAPPRGKNQTKKKKTKKNKKKQTEISKVETSTGCANGQ
jgi:hypothetical protein